LGLLTNRFARETFESEGDAVVALDCENLRKTRD